MDNLTIVATTPVVYAWTPSADFGATSTSATPTITPTTTGTHIYQAAVATSVNGCPLLFYDTVRVFGYPTAPVATNGAQCGAGVPNCFVTGTGNTFRWYHNQPSGGTALAGETGNHLHSFVVSTTDTFYVSEVSGNNRCEGPRTMVVETVSPSVPVTASVDTTSICPYQQVTLTASSADNNYVYTWIASPAPGSGFPSNDTLIGNPIVINPAVSGTYTYAVYAVDIAANCSATATSPTVTVRATPAVVISPNSSAICLGGSVQPTLTSGGGSFTMYANDFSSTSLNATQAIIYSTTSTASITGGRMVLTPSATSDDGGFRVLNPNGINRNAFSVNFDMTADTPINTFGTGGADGIGYSYGDDNTYSTATDPSDAFGTKLRVVFDAAGNSPNLAGIYVTYGSSITTAAPAPSDAGVLGYTADLTSWKIQTDKHVAIVVNNSGQLTLTVGGTPIVFTSGPSGAALPANTTVLQLPAAYLSANKSTWTHLFSARTGGDAMRQAIDNLNISYSSPLLYSWSPSADITNPTSATPTITPTTAGMHIYFLTATDTTGSFTCPAVVPDTVIVNPIPVVTSHTDSTQCGYHVPYCSVSGTGTNFHWFLTSSGGTAIPGETGPQLTSYAISSTTTFYVSSYSVSTGCEGARVAVTETVTQPDAVNVTHSGTHCVGGPVTFTANQSGSSNTYNFVWTAVPSSGSGLSGSPTGTSLTVNPSATGVYIYAVTATDASTGCVAIGTDTFAVVPPPTVTVSASADSVCPGSATILTATATPIVVGTPNGATITTVGSPFRTAQAVGNQIRTQYLVLASELSAAGFHAGNITSIGMNETQTGLTGSVSNFSISIGNTAATSLGTTFLTDPLTTVRNPVSYTPVVGQVTFAFNTPFFWNGTSNIVINMCAATAVVGGGTSWATYATSFMSTIGGAGSTTGCTVTTGTNPTSTGTRPVFTFGVSYPSVTYSWSPVSLTGNPVTVNPISQTTYTVTATDTVYGCTATATKTITMKATPTAPTPVVQTSTQCGVHVPGIKLQRAGGSTDTFKWYTVAVNGTAISGQTDSVYTATISTSTTFWVSEFNGTCESPRTMLTANVTQPDDVTLNASSTGLCLGQSSTLSTTQIGSTNSYAYSWTANPSANSGLSSGTGTPVTATPTAIGSYIYTLTATDNSAGCVVVKNVTVGVGAVPVITSAVASPLNVCQGSFDTLTALTGVPGGTSFHEGFESFPVTTFSSSGNVTWAGSSYFSEGSASVQATYPISADGNLAMTSSLDLSTMVGPHLEFDHICATENSFDYGRIEYSLNGGSTWTGFPVADYQGSGTLAPNMVSAGVIGFQANSYSGWPTTAFPTSPATSIFKHEIINLASYASSNNFRVRFRLTSDPSVLYAGWLIDNVRITTTSSSGAGTYTWVWNPGNISGNVAVIPATTVGTYTYSVTAFSNGCASATSPSVTFTVNPTPTSPTAHDSTHCGQQVPFCYVTGSGPGAKFHWYLSATGGTALADTGATLSTYIDSSTTTFYVAEFNGTCESPRVAVHETVTPADPVTASANPTNVCVGGLVTLTAAHPGSTNNYTYGWTSTTGGGLNSTSGISVTANPTVSGNTVYIVTATDAAAGCVMHASASIGTLPSPILVVTPAVTDTLCFGTQEQLLATANFAGNAISLNGSNQYVAIPPASNLTLSSTTGNSLTLEAWINETAYPTAAPGDAGIISHYQSATGGASYFLRVNEVSPYNGVAAGGASIAATTTASVTLGTWAHWAAVYSYNSATSNDSVKLYKNGVLQASGVSTVPVSSDSLKIGVDFSSRFFNGKIDEVRVWNTALSAATINTWMSQPVVSAHPNYANLVGYYDFNESSGTTVIDKSGNGNNGFIRNGAVRVVSTVPMGGGITYSWSPGAGLSDSTIANPVATFASPGIYNYTVTAAAVGACSSTATARINVLAAPIHPLITSSVQAICNSGSVTFTLTNPHTGNTIQWQSSPDSINWTNVSGANGVTYNAAPSSTTYYRVYVTCSGSDTSSVIKMAINSPTITSTTNDTICGSGNAVISVTGTGTFDWYTAQTGGTSLFTGPVYTVPVTANTVFWVESHIGSCQFAGGRQPVFVTVTTPPSISVAPVSISCPGAPVTITATSSDAGYAYTWTSVPAGFNGTGASQSVSPNDSTTYTVTGIDGNGCHASASVLVPKYHVTNPTLASTAPGVCEGAGQNPVLLSVTTAYVSYSWNSGAGTSSTYSITTAGTYHVAVTDNHSCVTTGSITIQSYALPPVPIVTPSGTQFLCFDGMNGADLTLTADTTGAGAGASLYWGGQLGESENPVTIFAADYGPIGFWEFQLSVTNAHQCVSYSDPIDVVYDPQFCNSVVNVRTFIQGYYLGNHTMRPVMRNENVPGATTSQVDTITVELRDTTTNAHSIVESFTGILDTAGYVSCTFSSSVAGGSYYIVLQHRNSLETWSALPVAISSATSYDFSTAASQAYGNNLKDVLNDGVWSIYNGDVARDGVCDGSDYIAMQPNVLSVATGYRKSDVNGDGVVDGSDYIKLQPNVLGTKTVHKPQ